MKVLKVCDAVSHNRKEISTKRDQKWVMSLTYDLIPKERIVNFKNYIVLKDEENQRVVFTL